MALFRKESSVMLLLATLLLLLDTRWDPCMAMVADAAPAFHPTQDDFDRRMLQEAQIARETAFLQELHYALGMDHKSPAIHNWFRENINNVGVSSNSSSSSMADLSSIGVSYCGFTGVQCDMDGRVTILDLSSKGLDGTLPASFAPLTRLQRLLLRNNAIGGSVPGILPETLIHFNVDRNRLQGTIPSFHSEDASLNTAGNASGGTSSLQLERLILSDNLLEGSLPTSICSLRKLKAINVSRNPDIQGRLPECLANLTDLRGLQVVGTSIIGPILPPELCHTEVGTTATTTMMMMEGYCDRFDFCLDGYQQIASFQDGVEKVVSCKACDGPSNGLASRTCVQSAYPSDSPSLVPSIAPTPMPSALPSSSPPPSVAPNPQDPSGAPSTTPTTTRNKVFGKPTTFRSSKSPWKHFKLPSESNDDGSPSSSPTFFDPLDGEGQPWSKNGSHYQANKSGGRSSQERATAAQQHERSFYDNERAFLSVFILLFLFGMATCFLAVPRLWNQHRKRKANAFGALASPPDEDGSKSYGTDDDKDNNKDAGEEEITFSKDDLDWCVGLDDLLEAGESYSIGECKECGCHISASSHDEPGNKNMNEDEHLSTTSEANTILTHSGETMKNPTTSSALFASTVGSLFCAAPSCMMMPHGRNNITMTSQAILLEDNEEMWTFSRPSSTNPPPRLQEDAYDRPDITAESSSLSSTTPMLNPLDSLRAKMAPLSMCTPNIVAAKKQNRQVDKKDPSTLIAEYARKYFPDEMAPPRPAPPVDQVDCFSSDPSVSLSLSISQEDTTGNHNGSRSPQGDLSSFRPPRFYNKMKNKPTSPPPNTKKTPVSHDVIPSRTEANEDYYSVLGIRSPFADQQSDDDYEFEIWGL